ncbi:MAG: DNA polymerase III subunit gamma/tau, partial [Thermomicrobiales bacterium]
MTGLPANLDEPSPPLLLAPADATPTSGVAASQSLYRKYRPQSFDADDLVGQEHVVRTLRNAIRLDRIAHAYLFCGPRGTGKTTTARLIAKAVNCLHPDPDRRPCNECASCRAISSGAATDVVEIDAASNRGIDDIRDLRERVKYAPTQLRYKFYIVDEAHQITGAAANAFLKTLEEPPAHTKFVLATTDPEELLPTIVSRCQRFDFRRISADAMASRLRTVAAEEAIPITDEAISEISRYATGSLRDALGLLDQLALHGGEDGSTVDAEAVRALLGISRNDRVGALLGALADLDASAALEAVNVAVESGEDPRQLNRQLVAALRAIMQDRAANRPTPGDLGPVAERFDLARLADLLRRFSEVDYRIRHSSYAHLPLELALVDSIISPAAKSPQQQATTQPLSPDAAAIDPGQPTSRLRDRVRGESSSPSRPPDRAPAERGQASPPAASQQLEPATGSAQEAPTPIRVSPPIASTAAP